MNDIQRKEQAKTKIWAASDNLAECQESMEIKKALELLDEAFTLVLKSIRQDESNKIRAEVNSHQG